MAKLGRRAIKAFLNRPQSDWSVYKTLSRRRLNALAARYGVASPFWDKLRKPQQIMALIGLRTGRFAFLADTGVGKTVSLLFIFNALRQQRRLRRVLVLVPRKPNRDEWSDEVAKHVPHLSCQVMPSEIKLKWLEVETGRSLFVFETYAGLLQMVSEKAHSRKKRRTVLKPSRKLLKQLTKQFDAVVFDECFPAGTKIATPHGHSPIELLRVGDQVVSSLGTSKIKDVFKRRSSIIVKVKLADGRVISSTPNHPFLTTVGWVCAGNLRGQYVLSAADLRMVRQQIQLSNCPELANKAILWDIVLSEVADVPTEKHSETTYATSKPKTDHDLSQKSAFAHSLSLLARKTFAQDNAREDQRHAEAKWKILQNSWWQRHWIDGTAAAFANGIRLAVESGIRHNIGPMASWLSNLLQGRFSLPEQEMDHRMRWHQPPQPTTIRSKARCETLGTRVEDITFEQRENPIDVYDFELEGTPHFCAEGVLVHNSQALKNKAKLPFRICRKLAQSCKYVFLLSATPHGRDPADLWAQMFLVDGGETLGETLGLFRAVYYDERPGYWTMFEYTFDKAKESQLHQRLSNCSIRFKADEADLPKLVPVVKKVSLPAAADVYYQRAKRNLMAGRNYREMQSSWLRMRQISSGFVGFHDDDSGGRAEVAFDENPKLDMLMSIIDGIDPAYKFIVFVEYTWSGERIMQELKRAGIKAVHLYGKAKDTKQLRHQFNTDPDTRGLVLQNSFGIGLNLQAARYMIFFESPVAPDVRYQCQRRVERQFSQHKTVFMYDLVVKDTYDEAILKALEEGRDLFAAIIDGIRKRSKAA